MLPISRKKPKIDSDITVLIKACQNSIENIKKLIESGADIHARDKTGGTVLTIGLTDVNVIELLIENGANVNAQEVSGLTPLMVYATYYRQALESKTVNNNNVDKISNIIYKLIDSGADIEIKDNNDNSAIYYGGYDFAELIERYQN